MKFLQLLAPSGSGKSFWFKKMENENPFRGIVKIDNVFYLDFDKLVKGCFKCMTWHELTTIFERSKDYGYSYNVKDNILGNVFEYYRKLDDTLDKNNANVCVVSSEILGSEKGVFFDYSSSLIECFKRGEHFLSDNPFLRAQSFQDLMKHSSLGRDYSLLHNYLFVSHIGKYFSDNVEPLHKAVLEVLNGKEN